MTLLRRAFETPMSLRHTQPSLPREQNPASSLSPAPLPSLAKQASQTRLWPQSTEQGPETDGRASGTSSRELTATRSKLHRRLWSHCNGLLRTPENYVLYLPFGFSGVGNWGIKLLLLIKFSQSRCTSFHS